MRPEVARRAFLAACLVGLLMAAAVGAYVVSSGLGLRDVLIGATAFGFVGFVLTFAGVGMLWQKRDSA